MDATFEELDERRLLRRRVGGCVGVAASALLVGLVWQGVSAGLGRATGSAPAAAPPKRANPATPAPGDDDLPTWPPRRATLLELLPRSGSLVAGATVDVEGRADGPAVVRIGGVACLVEEDGTFRRRGVPLAPGMNVVEVEFAAANWDQAIDSRRLLYFSDPDPPTLIVEGACLDADVDDTVEVFGRVEDASEVEVTVDGRLIAQVWSGGGAFSGRVARGEVSRAGALRVEGRDAAGNVARAEVRLVPDVAGVTSAYQRLAARRAAVATRGGTVATEAAVSAGLEWLARHEAPGGGWGCDAYRQRCAGAACGGAGPSEFDVGVTGLALLAFLGAGHTHRGETPHAPVVRRGLAYLRSRQEEDGRFGPASAEYMYGHALATQAMVQAWSLCGAASYREAARRGLRHLLDAQAPGAGWRYTPRPPACDSSITGWAVRALLAGRRAGLDVPAEAFEGALAFLERATETATGMTGYDRMGTLDVYVPGKNEAWSSHPTYTAIAMWARGALGSRTQLPPERAAGHLHGDVPAWDPVRGSIDVYYWHHGTLALFQARDGTRTASTWRRWNEALHRALVPSQASKGCAAGSWDPALDRWGFAGGRVYVTALNVLTLETYYRDEGLSAKEP